MSLFARLELFKVADQPVRPVDSPVSTTGCELTHGIPRVIGIFANGIAPLEQVIGVPGGDRRYTCSFERYARVGG